MEDLDLVEMVNQFHLAQHFLCSYDFVCNNLKQHP